MVGAVLAACHADGPVLRVARLSRSRTRLPLDHGSLLADGRLAGSRSMTGLAISLSTPVRSMSTFGPCSTSGNPCRPGWTPALSSGPYRLNRSRYRTHGEPGCGGAHRLLVPSWTLSVSRQVIASPDTRLNVHSCGTETAGAAEGASSPEEAAHLVG